MAVKFNDYFEFPREFDMAPYTAATLAELEGAETRNNQIQCTCIFVCSTVVNRQQLTRVLVVDVHENEFLEGRCPLTVESWRYLNCVVTSADGIKSLRSKAEPSNMTGTIQIECV